MIRCRDLIKIFEDEENEGNRIPALRGFDLDIKEGTIVSMVGPSGSGKTTLINILSGLLKASSGECKVGNYDLELMNQKSLNKYRLKNVGIIDQFPERTLFLDATVEENMNFSVGLIFGNSTDFKSRNLEILETLGIDHLISRRVRFLSGGEMTRTAVACALAKNVPLLLCDEPTGQLDSLNTEKVKNLLRKVAHDFGTTILVVTHDYRFFDGVDKTCEIRDGRVTSMLSLEEQMLLNGNKEYPLKFRGQIDSSNSVRIPDLVLRSLKVKREVDFELFEEGEVKLSHPENLPPERVVKEDIKVRRKDLYVNPLSQTHFTGKEIMVDLQDVSKTYRGNGAEVEALQNINLKLYKGELIFVLGPSGSGKTTLIKLLSGLDNPTSGSIFYQNTDFTKLSDMQKSDFRRNEMGLVSQQGNLHPFLTIDDNFYLKDIFSGNRYTNATNLDERNVEYLTKFKINHRKNSYPLEISGGELQRASLAIANYSYPPIIILDEPTANFDSELATHAIEEIYATHKNSDTTFIIATHDIALIKDGIRAIELQDGQISKDGIVFTK